jgi:pimeloyl-ACP methyl ester carboxylesterase
MKPWAITAALGLVALLVVVARRESPPAATEGPRLPVLLVHGSGLDSSSWDALVAHLRVAGWPAEYLRAVDLTPNDGANIPAAEDQLRPAALGLLAAAGDKARREGWSPPGKLAIVAHSMGAVSGRWLATRLMPERIAVFVALAGANHGTEALCGLRGAGNEELCPAPESRATSVLAELNGTKAAPRDETPFGPAPDPPSVPGQRPTAAACIAWYTVFIDPDEWIVPASSARLAGAGGGLLDALPPGLERTGEGEYRLLDRVRHDDVASAAAVARLVASMLAGPTGCPPI